MKVELTKQDLLDLSEGLKGLGKVKGDIRFNYGISKNKRIIRDEVEILEELANATDEFVEYEKSRIKVVEKHAKKDDNGGPKIIRVPVMAPNGEGTTFTTRYDVNEGDPKFKMEIKALKKKHKTAIDGQVKHEEDFEKLLKDKIEMDLHLIPLSTFPQLEESIFDNLYPLIFDDLHVKSAEEEEEVK